MKFAVVGHPVAHSKSPAMHMAAYRALGLSHTYEALDVSENDFPEVMRSLKCGDFQGFNVTVPHKLRAFELADERASSAIAVGAANTLVRSEDGKITAHNTDADALYDDLRFTVHRGYRALVIGSGGAARAAIVALVNLRCDRITVVARNVEAAKKLNIAIPHEIALLGERVHSEFEIAVQTTSAGMQGADDGEIVASCIDWKHLSRQANVYDVVYSPPETPFLRAARSAGIPARNGIGMLANQGAMAFELWLKIGAPLEAMRRALRE